MELSILKTNLLEGQRMREIKSWKVLTSIYMKSTVRYVNSMKETLCDVGITQHLLLLFIIFVVWYSTYSFTGILYIKAHSSFPAVFMVKPKPLLIESKHHFLQELLSNKIMAHNYLALFEYQDNGRAVRVNTKVNVRK